MEFSEKWCREWVHPQLDSQQLADLLTMAGLEIAAVTPACGDLSQVVVGQVTADESHPDSDRLFICAVNVGLAKAITVVTNDASVQKGEIVAVALVGARLADDTIISETTLRGVVSQGMFCSLKTLGLTEEDEGIYRLPVDTQPGLPFADALQLTGDNIFELEITPNRGDCLSIAGIAREISVLTGCELHAPNISAQKDTGTTSYSVKITAPDYCPHYVGRAITDVDVTRLTPLWMKERLRRSGMRSINPVVDVTNYVLLELGQPMHAFDCAKLQGGGIVVRTAVTGEHLVLLNGQSITLQSGQLIIADQQQPLALAGIMGGEPSGVSTATRAIFLESAYFEPTQISKTARFFGLSSDSSYRFERGVDPTLQVRAIERATELLLTIVGGKAQAIIDETAGKFLPPLPTIRLRQQKITALLGFEIPEPTVETILKRLNMKITTIQSHATQPQSPKQWDVVPPPYRHDIGIEADLIEELIRVDGYDKIPQQALVKPLRSTLAAETRIPLSTLKDLLVHRGYQEVITYSFVDETLQKLFNPTEPSIALTNPISQELGVMRSNCWSGLVNVMQYNTNRQQKRCRFFETGLRFRLDDGVILQEPVIAGLVSGTAHPEQWGSKSTPVDFYDLKNDVEALLSFTHSAVTFQASHHPALHPVQQAAIFCDGLEMGLIGKCHPDIHERLKLKHAVFLFECLQQPLKSTRLPRYLPLSKFPAIRRDVGLVVNKAVTAQQLIDIVLANKPIFLIDVSIFDVYAGSGLAENEKNVAIGLIFQHLSHTLIESEVTESTEEIVSALANTVGAKLRDW